MPETTPPDSAAAPSAEPTAAATPAEVVVRYRYSDGILLEGETYPHKDKIKKAQPRWRWFRSLRKWGVPRTRDRILSRYQVEEYARGLERAGVPNVRADYQEPRPEDVRDFDEVREEQKERGLARAERLEERAERLDATAAQEYQKQRAIRDRMWPGQPILVGHHSERRHRRDLQRADRGMRRSIEASEAAKDARERSEAAERSVAQHASPKFALRRLLELAKEARKLQVDITGEVPTGWRGSTPRGPATGEWLAVLETAVEENRQKTTYYRRVLDEAGYMATAQDVLRPGDRVLTDKGGGVVQKTLSQRVEIRFDRAVSVVGGGRLNHVQRVAYDRVWVPKATVERRQGAPKAPADAHPGPSAVAPAQATAAAQPPAPPPKASAGALPSPAARADVPAQATAAAKAPTPTPKAPAVGLDALVAKHDDPEHYTGQQLTDALVEAERLGLGQQLARHFRSSLRDVDVLLAYGRARGIVAFENDAWPPAPLRGETYGKEDFRGILMSLDHHPVVVELLAEVRTWPERMKDITGSSWARWFPQIVRNATNVVHEHRAMAELDVARGEKPTPELARAAMNGVVASAKRQLQELREAQDPALYDPKSDPKKVYPRLCKLDETAARMVLEDVFGVEFDWEDKDLEASELCDGELTLETLHENAAKRAEEREAREETQRALREADALELLKVQRDAASRGEVTKGRFNHAYWRLHPGLTKQARDRRALTVTERHGKVEAIVRGPQDAGFIVSLPAGTGERAAIAALLREVEKTAGKAATATEATAAVKTGSKSAPGPKADVEAFAKKHGIGASLLSGDELHPIMVEAERLGIGHDLAQLISKKKLRHPDDLKVSFGRARGVVALENGAWPPPPLRGAVYGKHDFEGLIRSLEHHPMVAALHREASTWARRMKPITADRASMWFSKVVQHAERVVWDHLEVPLWEINRGTKTPTPELARKTRDTILRQAKEQLAQLRDALDPSLYDPKSDPEAVYPRLCKIDPASARLVLIDVFGISFEDRSETYSLCRGDTSLDDVNRKAKARKEESERRAAAQQAKREADARALVAVYRRAEKLGEVTRKRFNLAYWRQHPELRPWQRESRALSVRARHGVVEVSVRGPGEHGFYTTAKSGTGEAEAIAVLMREIEKEAGKASNGHPPSERTRTRPIAAPPAAPEIEEEPMEDEPETTKEPSSIESATAEPSTPLRGGAAPGSLWTVEEEGFALVAPPGDGKRVQVPTGHQPPLFDVGKPDPTVLERLRAEELAERRAKRPPPDTSDPLLVRAANDPPSPTGSSKAPTVVPSPTSTSGASPDAPSPASTSETPIETILPLRPWVGEIQTIANRMGPEGRYGAERVFISAVWKAVQGQPKLAGPSLEAFKARLVQANRDGLLRLHRADLVRAMDPELVRESEITHLNATFHFIETPPVVEHDIPRHSPWGTRPSDLRGVRGSHQRQVRAILTNRIADDGPAGISEISTKHEPGLARAAKAMAKRGEVKLVRAPRGYVRIMAGPKWGKADEPKPKAKAKAPAAGTVAPIKLTPAVARRVREEQAKLHQLPKHQDPQRRPVVVVAWVGRKRPSVFSRYHSEPLGALVTIDGYDRAQIVAEAKSTGPGGKGKPAEPKPKPKPKPKPEPKPAEPLEPERVDSFEEDLLASVADLDPAGLEPDNSDEAEALRELDRRGLVEQTPAGRYRVTPAGRELAGRKAKAEPMARLEYVDVATGVPADPSEPGTLSTGRIVAEIEGESVEIDEEDLLGHGSDPDPRKRRYRFDADSPADYPGQAAARKAERAAAKAGTSKKGKKAKGARTGLRATFDSPAKAAATFYEHNEDFFDHVVDPWDGLRDWMDGIEARVGRGHRKLSKTRAGQRILAERHAARAIRGALAYLMGQAKNRRWDAVPWAQVERLGEALARYFEAPSSGPGQPGLYWRPFTGTVRAEDLDAMTPEQRASVREQETVREIGEQLDELREAYDRAKDCMPDDLRRVIERRIGEWSRWVEDPSKIPAYACEPDPESAGYLCNYPAVAGELAELRKSCEDAYDPNWAANRSRQGKPGFPDTSGGEDESPPPRTASAKACCSRETPKAEVCSAPACQIAAGLVEARGEEAAGGKGKGSTKRPASAKGARKGAAAPPKPSAKTTKTSKRSPQGKKAAPPRPAAAGKQSPPKRPQAPKPKREPARKPTLAERKQALAERKKELARRRKHAVVQRRVQRLQCSAAVAMHQAKVIDTTSYRRRVEDSKAAVKKAEEEVKHHERDLKAAQRDAAAVLRKHEAVPKDRELARRKVRDARCQLRMAQGALRQRRRDLQRAETELQRMITRVRKREAVAAKRLEATEKAKDEALALASDGR